MVPPEARLLQRGWVRAAPGRARAPARLAHRRLQRVPEGMGTATLPRVSPVCWSQTPGAAALPVLVCKAQLEIGAK